MSIYDIFETKPLDEEGKWFDLGPKEKIKLRFMGSEAARRAHENLMRPYTQRVKMGIELTDEEAKQVNIKFLSETLILDWQGFTDRDGKEIKFTPAAAATLCEALPRLTALILRIAMEENNFEKEMIEAEAGN
mgnify:CR=1 FL=1